MNKLKTNERKKHKNVLIFVIFFINSYQLFCGDNLTLIITNLNDFDDIDQYKDITKFIYISEGIYSIPSGAFSEWPSVVSVNFGNSISDIGIYVFSSCSNLETIIFGGNVTTIGGGAFSFCSNLTLLILGYGIREIGGSAFGNCYQLECIYYYGETEPEIGEGAFYNVSTSVITYPTYKGSKFGHLGVTKENAEGTCNPIPTHSFSASHTFSNTYSQSNTFTESFQSDLTLSFSYTLTLTLTIAYSFTYYETQTRSLSLSIFNSTFSYVETEFLYYDYTVIMYSTHFNYYSNFITMLHTNILHTNGLTTNALIGIVCGSIASVLIIVGIVIFLIKSNNKKGKSTSTLQFKDSTTSSLNQIEDVNTLVEDIVKEDEDNWL